MKRWYSLIAVILYLLVNACTPMGQSHRKPPLVDYCDLVVNPSQYDGETVRISALQDAGWEWSYLTDKKCSTDSANASQTWLIIPDDAWCEGVRKTDISLPRGYSRSVSLEREVIVVVTFHVSEDSFRGSSDMELICLEKAAKWKVVR